METTGPAMQVLVQKKVQTPPEPHDPVEEGVRPGPVSRRELGRPGFPGDIQAASTLHLPEDLEHLLAR
jgi:hypothetical protein